MKSDTDIKLRCLSVKAVKDGNRLWKFIRTLNIYFAVFSIAFDIRYQQQTKNIDIENLIRF